MGRTKSITASAALALGTLAISSPAFAGADYLLEIKGVRGEDRTIEINSFSWGVSNPGAAITRRDTAPEHNGVLQVTSAREAGSGMASGRLACTPGSRLAHATLRGPTFTWTLHGVVVASCPNGGMTLSYQHAQAVRATKTRSNIQNN